MDKSDRLLARDFIDGDGDPVEIGATHGLGIASVILGSEEGYISGIAPQATLLPMRVAKIKGDGKIWPTPVLWGGGMRRLRNSIHHAINNEADIISISLGGTRGRDSSVKAMQAAVDRARRAGVIVLAAAGNSVGFVTSPANYDSVIAVAASNYHKERWDSSSFGRNVDVTAPGESVYKADVRKVIDRSSGTSVLSRK
ncbi:S8 family serine peptidase [Pontiellaceae bacterium B12219]|nr:S8 family serine peptidase [Pontiellaceae bacterium B12219]